MDYFLYCGPTVYVAKIIMANYKGTTAGAELLFCLASDKWCMDLCSQSPFKLSGAKSNIEIEGDKILVT